MWRGCSSGFPLSLRLVEEMIFERGMIAFYETIRRWPANLVGLETWRRTESKKSRKQKRTMKQLRADLLSLGYYGSCDPSFQIIFRLAAQQTVKALDGILGLDRVLSR